MTSRPSAVVRFSLFTLPMLLAQGCGGGLQVPEPDLTPRAGGYPAAEPAVIALPISLSLGKIRAALSTSLPPSDSLTRAQCVALGGAVCHQYVYSRDSLELRMNGDRVDLLTRLRYRGRVALGGVGGLASCGYAPEPMKRAELHAATSLYWRNDWHLASRNTSINVALPDPCEVTLLRVDVTPMMRRIIDAQGERLRQQLDSAIPALADLRPAADSLWHTMLRPFALDSASTTWLSMTPDAVLLARPIGRGDALATAIVITAYPRATLGARPATVHKPLPPLGLATTQSGIHVPVDILLPFADLSVRVTQLLRGDVPEAGITIDSVKVWAVGDTMVVRTSVRGSVTGDLFALGRVQYDPAARHLLVSDLQYTLSSESRMSRLKATLGSYRIKRALDLATGHGRLDVGTQLDSLRRQLSSQLNRPLAPGVEVSGTLTDIRIAALSTSASAFVLRVVIDGTARLVIR